MKRPIVKIPPIPVTHNINRGEHSEEKRKIQKRIAQWSCHRSKRNCSASQAIKTAALNRRVTFLFLRHSGCHLHKSPSLASVARFKEIGGNDLALIRRFNYSMQWRQLDFTSIRLERTLKDSLFFFVNFLSFPFSFLFAFLIFVSPS